MKSTWAVASDRIEFKCFPATQDLYKLGPVPGLCWPLFSYLHETLGVNRRRKWNDVWIGPRMWSVCYWTLAVSECPHPHIFCCLFMWFSWKDSHFSHCSLLNSSFLFICSCESRRCVYFSSLRGVLWKSSRSPWKRWGLRDMSQPSYTIPSLLFGWKNRRVSLWGWWTPYHDD